MIKVLADIYVHCILKLGEIVFKQMRTISCIRYKAIFGPFASRCHVHWSRCALLGPKIGQTRLLIYERNMAGTKKRQTFACKFNTFIMGK